MITTRARSGNTGVDIGISPGGGERSLCFANTMTEPTANKGLHSSSILLGFTIVFLSCGSLGTVWLEVRVLPGPTSFLVTF
jgi:hypothetical protein